MSDQIALEQIAHYLEAHSFTWSDWMHHAKFEPQTNLKLVSIPDFCLRVANINILQADID